MIRIKFIGKFMRDGRETPYPSLSCGDCLFIMDPRCREYDWAVVYDELPPWNAGSIRGQCEELACPPEQTILVTQEPPTIKLYPRTYTRQFGYVITTQLPCFLRHPNHCLGRGTLLWMADYPYEEAVSMPDYPKSKTIATVCSAKRQRHTLHHDRYALTSYLSQHMPELQWFGRGVRELKYKYEAMNDYRYQLAVENYIEDYHWSDKISDPILALCLTFYAGDPKLGEVLPPESFIPIPLHDHEAALRIMQEAIRNNEYEKRLPAIREARRLIVEKYNTYRQIESVILRHMAAPTGYRPPNGGRLMGRHRLRRNPINALSAAWDNVCGHWKLGIRTQEMK